MEHCSITDLLIVVIKNLILVIVIRGGWLFSVNRMHLMYTAYAYLVYVIMKR